MYKLAGRVGLWNVAAEPYAAYSGQFTNTELKVVAKLVEKNGKLSVAGNPNVSIREHLSIFTSIKYISVDQLTYEVAKPENLNTRG